VDVGLKNSYAEGVKAVADAIGYSTTYSPEEQRAHKSGCMLPDLDSMGETALENIMSLFKKACSELKNEGLLNTIPTLVLDHATRPLTDGGRRAQQLIRNYVVDDLDKPQPEMRSTIGDTLIRVFLDAAKGTHHCRFCIVTSDVYAEQSVIRCKFS
jgi:hypothetical protein